MAIRFTGFAERSLRWQEIAWARVRRQAPALVLRRPQLDIAPRAWQKPAKLIARAQSHD
jgi:hypothetical protein